MIEIVNLDTIVLDRLERINPSSFFSFKRCAKKSLLSKKTNTAKLLLSPNAYYGSVIHKLLDEIASSKITNEIFEDRFKALILLAEKKMLQEGYKSPNLQILCKNFALKKLFVKDKIKNKNTIRVSANSNYSFKREVWIQNEENTMGGNIDLIKEYNDHVSLIDYKTGQILDKSLKEGSGIKEGIKQGYITQMKLYAYLYYLKENKFPDKLILINLENQEFEIRTNIDDSKDLYIEAIAYLKKVNSNIVDRVQLASPNEENCQNCLYRPSCLEYINTFGIHERDIIGHVINIEKLINGQVVVQVQGAFLSKIFGIDESYEFDPNMKYGFFNLKKRSNNKSYFQISRYSKIFKYTE